ncbi:MAG: DUF2207 domain-containing protein [Patescibacteria group bacterium]
MKVFFKILFTFTFFLFFSAPVLARENVSDWYLKDFQTEIIINQDSSLDITENILADCGNALDKHGIFRSLPKEYRTKDGNFVLPLELISIANEKGEKLPYSQTSDRGAVTYKIGDPNISVQGQNFYQIKYRLKNAIRTNNLNFDELYWNVLGNYWDLEIDKFSAKIIFPARISKENTGIYYYAGTLGSKDSSAARYQWLSDNILEVDGLRPLLKKEGVTISATFPKNIISPYQLTFQDKYGFSVFELIIALFIPVIIFFISYFLWNKYGRDPHLNKTVIPEFEIPENLSPMEMGGIIKKGKLEKNSLAASIIRFGVFGYLKIEKTDRQIAFLEYSSFTLIRTEKQLGDDLYEAEKFVIGKIFEEKNEVRLYDLRNSLSKELSKISDIILKDFGARGFVDRAGENYAKGMFISCGVLLFSSFIFAARPVILISLIVSAIIVFIFTILMEKLTPRGAELNWRIKGFKLYMNTAEKYRSRFQEQEGIMDKLLPYAILFGITKEWLKKIKEINGDQYLATYHPAFFVGAVGFADFNNFTDTINQITDSVASSVSPSSSGAGGGGGAGGGAGGGGGGGW